MAWRGVDLDGTLAYYFGWRGLEHIGAPIPRMVKRVKRWIQEGWEVRIVTARVHHGEEAVQHIKNWCREYIGKELPVTAEKDFDMVDLWDDRVVQVVPNTGRPLRALMKDWEKKAKDAQEVEGVTGFPNQEKVPKPVEVPKEKPKRSRSRRASTPNKLSEEKPSEENLEVE
jgi:hypothetical protein